MNKESPTTPSKVRCTRLVLWAALLSLFAVIVFIGGFVLYDPHGINAHDDWRHRPDVIAAVIAGPLCILLACVLCLLTIILEGMSYARAALIAALAGLVIICVLVWMSCGAFASHAQAHLGVQSRPSNSDDQTAVNESARSYQNAAR